MKAYRVLWLVFTGVLGVAGAAMAFTWSVANVIMLVVLAALMGGVVAMVVLANPDEPPKPPRERQLVVARSTALSAAGTLSFIGLGTLLGPPTAVLLAVLVVGGSPSAIRYSVRWLSEHGHVEGTSAERPRPALPDRLTRSVVVSIAGTGPGSETRPHVAPHALSDEALCLAWRANFSALQKAGSPTQRLRIVDERRAYLDEIERRTAHGMAAWLASGPRAAGDPSRFVVGDGAAGRARIDWDDLLHDMDK
jgi:hypothetical protein